jgi:hypothetical protein
MAAATVSDTRQQIAQAREAVVDVLIQAVPHVCQKLMENPLGRNSQSIFAEVMARDENRTLAAKAGFTFAHFDPDLNMRSLRVKFGSDKRNIFLGRTEVAGVKLHDAFMALKKATESSQLNAQVSSFLRNAVKDAFRAAVLIDYCTFDRSEGRVHDVTLIRRRVPTQRLVLEALTGVEKVEYNPAKEELMFTLRGSGGEKQSFECPLYEKPRYDPSGEMPIGLSGINDQGLRVAAQRYTEESLTAEFSAVALSCNANYVSGRSAVPPGFDDVKSQIETRSNSVLLPSGDPRVKGLQIEVYGCNEDQGIPFGRESLTSSSCYVFVTSGSGQIECVMIPLPELAASPTAKDWEI